MNRACAVNRSVPMLVSAQPDQHREQSLDQRRTRQQHYTSARPSTIRAKYSARAERQREGGDRGGAIADRAITPKVPAMNRAMARDA